VSAQLSLSSSGSPDRVGCLPTHTGDEGMMDAISAIIASCSGPMASGGQVRDYKYGDISVRICEGALGDGLGAKVWTVAHLLCRSVPILESLFC
jgi:hypothetical protein